MTIRAAYAACHALAQQNQDGWNNWLDRACEAAQGGERQHRAGTGTWRISAIDAARYFAVKWFLDKTKGPENWAAACSLRDDCRYALGARDLCPKPALTKLRRQFADVLAFEYTTWVTR